MSDVTSVWLDIVFVAAAITFLKGAMAGKFYSSGRGGHRPLFATVNSIPARLAIGAASLGLLAFALWDFLRKTWLAPR